MINVYGPCQNWVTFWDQLLRSRLLQVDNVILGDDLNFSIGYSESWGHNAQIDSLSYYFESFLEDHGLIDIPSTQLQPT